MIHVFNFPDIQEGTIAEGTLPAVVVVNHHGATANAELARLLQTKHGGQPVKGDDLTAIDGIGEAMAEQLASVGIYTKKALVDANPADLDKILPVSEAQVKGWQKQAKGGKPQKDGDT